MTSTILNSNLEDFKFVKKGKVRDMYDLNDNLLLVSTDRISAFDVVFNEGIPKKGEVLNKLSLFWFNKTKHIIPNHVIDSYPEKLADGMKARSVVGLKATPIKLECVVRGYLTGSGWRSYKKTGKINDLELPAGLHDGSKLPEPLFTPTTKEDSGHDRPLTQNEAKELVGPEIFFYVKRKARELYDFAHREAMGKGLVLADTKFEFGIVNIPDKGKTIILIDECLTPDSSRYWLKEEYDKGNLVSLDKEFVRKYLMTLDWDKKPPAPKLPDEVVEKTTQRYIQTYKMLTGEDL